MKIFISINELDMYFKRIESLNLPHELTYIDAYIVRLFLHPKLRSDKNARRNQSIVKR